VLGLEFGKAEGEVLGVTLGAEDGNSLGEELEVLGD
jgi:hypothetical protein